MTFAPTPVDTSDDTTPEPAADPIAMILGEQLRDQIWMASATSPRSTQTEIGPSELGTPCDRQLAYRMRGHRKVNHPDPLRTLVGSGVHAVLESMFRRIDGGSDRFLIEQPASYRGVPGTVDLYDARRAAVLDWKSTTKRRLRDVRRSGPPDKYRTQAQIYGAGLAEAGWPVRVVGLVFIPIDGELSDIWVWTAAPDRGVADAAIDRMERLAQHIDGGTAIADIPAEPTRLCPWCSHYRPGSTDLAVGCPGSTTPGKDH